MVADDLFQKTRIYGRGGTIHATGHVDVEVDAGGQVVAVWFRCQPLPFRQAPADGARARTMRDSYAELAPPRLAAVELIDEGRST